MFFFFVRWNTKNPLKTTFIPKFYLKTLRTYISEHWLVSYLTEKTERDFCSKHPSITLVFFCKKTLGHPLCLNKMKQLTFFPIEKSWMSHHFHYFEVKSADNQIWRYILKGVTSTLEFPISLSSSFFPTREYRYFCDT